MNQRPVDPVAFAFAAIRRLTVMYRIIDDADLRAELTRPVAPSDRRRAFERAVDCNYLHRKLGRPRDRFVSRYYAGADLASS